MDNELRLFVWTDALYGYFSGIMFSLAHNVDEARVLLREKIESLSEYEENDIKKEPQVYTGPVAFYMYGGD